MHFNNQTVIYDTIKHNYYYNNNKTIDLNIYIKLIIYLCYSLMAIRYLKLVFSISGNVLELKESVKLLRKLNIHFIIELVKIVSKKKYFK